mmetsp:Transcript_35097/g.69154  ORF Transcript_35097/g.69154 Transcript_35097/m.69154 type:complete len:514 (+) Transcript_35097:40-1581(+)
MNAQPPHQSAPPFPKYPSLPLDGGGRLGANVVTEAVDPPHLVDNPAPQHVHHLVGQAEKVRRHVVRRLHAPHAGDALVRPPVAHDPHALHVREQDHERLSDRPVDAVAVQLLHEDRVGVLERRHALRRDLAEDADGEAGSREGVAPHALFFEAQGQAEGAHLVLEEFAHGLDELHLHVRRQAPDVVVRLDGGRGSLVGNGFDHVRVERPLEQVVAGFSRLGDDGRGFLLENVDEGPPDDLALPLRVRDPRQPVQKYLAGVHALEIDAAALPEAFVHLLRLVLAETAVVHHDGVEAIPDRLLQEEGRHARIDAAGDRPQHVSRRAHLETDPLNKLRRVVPHDPVLGRGAHPHDEIAEDVLPLRTVRHLRMELQPVHLPLRMFDDHVLRIVRGRHPPKPRRQAVDFVPVAHPHDELLLQPLQQRTAALRRRPTDLRRAVLPRQAPPHGPAEHVGELLHAVTDAEDRDAPALDHRPHAGVHVGGVGVVHGTGAAGEHDAADVRAGGEDGGRHRTRE